MNEERTIIKQMQDIAEQICDKYCKYPEQWEGDADEMIDTICTECPLTRL